MIGVFAVARIAVSYKPRLAGAAPVPVANIAREYLDAFILAGLVALFLVTFVLRAYYIPSGSMAPTLQIHDVLLVDELEYRFHRPRDGDIVVFKPPVPSPDDFIKRVIAGPGETLRVAHGTVYVDGKARSEPFVAQRPAYDLVVKNYGIYVDAGGDGDLRPIDPAYADVPPRSFWEAPDRIPRDFYFVMGDNRNRSDDSHIWGFAQFDGRFAAGPLTHVAAAQLRGRALLLFWPLARVRIL